MELITIIISITLLNEQTNLSDWALFIILDSRKLHRLNILFITETKTKNKTNHYFSRSENMRDFW